jgi:N-acetylglucosaminyl-diphospho-decaprenol L-rhamnosyltransferase
MNPNAHTMISFVIPTRNRPERLAATLDQLESLARSPLAPRAEVLIADNASDVPVTAPRLLAERWPVRVLRQRENLGAAARNVAARESDASCGWLVMLDDDSHPIDLAFVSSLARAGANTAALMADIRLPHKRCRESGGLPEVFIGCGVAIRREAFLAEGGYDPGFHYYAEEYDLAAKLLRRGMRIEFEPAFRVEHWKVDAHRDMNTIVARLVRNNGWVMQRYAPEGVRRRERVESRKRYRAIAAGERAMQGYARGIVELRSTLARQARTPMSEGIFARFTGLAAAREALQAEWSARRFASACMTHEGKNSGVVRTALRELGVRVESDASCADALVIGTMSPGPMLDAADRLARADRRVIAPWSVAQTIMPPLATAA